MAERAGAAWVAAAARRAGVSPAERPRRSGGETVVVPEEEEEAQEAQEAQEARSGCSLAGTRLPRLRRLWKPSAGRGARRK